MAKIPVIEGLLGNPNDSSKKPKKRTEGGLESFY